MGRFSTSMVAATIAFFFEIGSLHAAFEDSDQQRQARWQDLAKQIFGEKTPIADKAIALDAPARAEDAALVPITITIAKPENVKALYLVIDDNPSPIAAHFVFGPSVDPRQIKLRVRVNTYTDMHVVAETSDGKLLMAMAYVKASGGCSAPMGVSDEEAMKGMGDMKLKFSGDVSANKPVDATLMIRHPNFNGMQQNQQTQAYTPARYIQSIDVTYNDRRVFSLGTDISLASNPVISFDLLPSAAKGTVKVNVKDSQDESWSKDFSVPSVSN